MLVDFDHCFGYFVVRNAVTMCRCNDNAVNRGINRQSILLECRDIVVTLHSLHDRNQVPVELHLFGSQIWYFPPLPLQEQAKQASQVSFPLDNPF